MQHEVLSLSLIPVLVLAAGTLLAAEPTNYDEAKVGNFPLPDPLRLQDGTPVRSAADWQARRRPEVRRLFEEHVYGRLPAWNRTIRSKVWDRDAKALGGLAVRQQVTVFFTDRDDGPRMDLLTYLPSHAPGPVPAFLGLNFLGNQCVHADPAIRLTDRWTRNDPAQGFANNRATEKTRALSSERWPVEKIVGRGYGLVTIYYGDLFPDHKDGAAESVLPVIFPPGHTPEPSDGQAIAVWAWGLSRALDYLETDRAVDARRVAVIGHSRLGKTSLWAGAADERFALVISNDSGEGGAALARRNFGETVADLNTRFPHWFCRNFARYNGRPQDLPVDQHLLIALAAPRPVYVASATEDRWADPRGEFLAAREAGVVYGLFQREGVGQTEPPAPDRSIGGHVGYHLRTGKHDITPQDWDCYLQFADRHLKKG